MSFTAEVGYTKALDLARNHYENFPVVSFLIKKELQKHVAIIYWFSRTADDIADEGNDSEIIRKEKLENFAILLKNALKGEYEDDYFAALSQTINEYNLSSGLFFDLLSAFIQDVSKKRYFVYDEIIDYCRRSANPVGRLVLELYGIRDKEALEKSDNICTALQITNFLQDIFVDSLKGRIYLSLEDCDKFGVKEKSFELDKNNYNLREIIKYYCEKTEVLFNKGKDLPDRLPGLLKYEISWTINGGVEILKKIKKSNYDIRVRPKLTKKDFLKILIKSVMK